MSSEQVRQWLEHAQRLDSAGRTPEAVAGLRRVLGNQPELAEVRQALIGLMKKVGQWSDLVSLLQETAEQFERRGLHKEAIPCYEEILRLEDLLPSLKGPEGTELAGRLRQLKPKIYLRMGEFHQRLRNLDVALSYLRKSQEVGPGRWETHLALGRAYAQKEQYREAIGEFQEILRLSPEQSGTAYEMLGEIFLRQGRPQNTVLPWFQRAAEHFLEGHRADDAKRVIARLLSLDPLDSVALQLRARFVQPS